MNKTNATRNFIPLAFLCLLATGSALLANGAPPSKEEIVGKAWKAMFGERRDAEIRSIYLEGYYHGRTEPNRTTVKRPNLFRNETTAGVLVFDGKRAAWATRVPDEKGNPRGPELIQPEYWRHFEVDIAIVFPAFFEYPAEFRGVEKVDGADAYVLFVRLPLGGSVTYFVDAQSFLVAKRLVDWDGDAKAAPWENRVDGYLNLDGILFPAGYSFEGRQGREEGLYKNVRFNVDAPDGLFQIPVELK